VRRRLSEEVWDVERSFELSEDVVERRLAEFSEGFAQRAGALADLFSRWREPEEARKVLETVIAGDGPAFRELIDLDLPVPKLNLCIWVFELIEKVAAIDTMTVCRLRNDLSPEEQRRYIAIVFEFRDRGELPPIVSTGDGSGGFINPPIPPGSFLNALKAEGLVKCEEEQIGGGLKLVPAKPRELCT
jgi:hypothetical protein